MDIPNYTGLKILIVEDFANYRAMLAGLFRELGCADVVAVSHGEQALEKCLTTRFDIIICDYDLGSGKNGQEFLEELRARDLTHPNDIFVIVTADSSKEIVMSSYDYHPDAYLAKPLTMRVLQSRVDRLLRQRKAMAPYYRALDNDRWEDAEAFAREEIIKSGRYQAAFQKVLADEYLHRGDLENAQDIYRQVLEIRDVDWAQVGMARVKLAEGDIATAQKWTSQIITQFPHCLSAYDTLADVYRASYDRKQLELTLLQVADLSPLSYQRQIELGRLAADLQDYEVALRAFSRAIRTGRYSYYRTVEPYLDYSRSGVAILKSNEDKAQDIVRGVRRVLDSAEHEFELGEEMNLQNQLIRCQFNATQGKQAEALSLYEDLKDTINSHLQTSNVDTRLDIYRTLLAMKEDQKASSYLNDIVAKFKGDEAALQRIDPYLEEIKSKENIKAVAKINEQAIELYQQRRYADAIEQFAQALSTFPKITALRLNVFQAMIDSLTEQGSQALVKKCSEMETELKESINVDNKHFKRFNQLRQRLRVYKNKTEID